MTTLEAPALTAPRTRSLSEIVTRENERTARRRWGALAALVLVPASIAVAGLALRPRPLPLSARFRTALVTHGDVVREVRATGHVEAVTTVQVGAEISGRIASVEVDYNDRVVHGQVLARFDPVALSAQRVQAEANLAAARAALEQARTDRERSDGDLRRAVRLYEQKVIPDTERDNIGAAARLATQRVAAAEAQVAAQSALLTVAKTSLDHAVIRAPIDGVVISRNVDPGQTVASMLQTPILFSVAADLRKMRVVAAVDEADIGEIVVGQKATFTVNAYPDRVFQGTVTEVRNSPVVVQDVVTYGSVIEVDNLDLALKPGMTAAARIKTATALDADRVPAVALRFVPPGEKAPARPSVWVFDGKGTRAVEVNPGVSDGELTAVAPASVGAGTSVLVELTPEGRKAYGIGR